MSKQIIIADTSTLIALSRIGKIGILHELFDKITITQKVREEFEEDLPEWFDIAVPADKEKIKFLTLNLDEGEASAIVLASELQNSLLIIDEKKGRSIAKSLGIKIIGLIGILIKAKENSILTSVSKTLDELESQDFRISKDLKRFAIQLAGELNAE